MAWVGVEYSGLGSPGADIDEKSLACVIKSSAGDTACSAVAAVVLEIMDDGDQDKPQLTFSAVAAPIARSGFSSEVEREEAISADPEPDIEGAGVSTAGGFNEIDKEVTFDEEFQYIGELIDPDAEDSGLLRDDKLPVSVGQFIDPDTEEIGLSTEDEPVVVIGEFIDPNAV